MIHKLGPAYLGFVIGWVLYYFMRKYKVFSPQTLTATITAFFGGEIISVLHKVSNENTDVDLWYFLGVGIGFSLYALYVGTLSILYVTGKIKNYQLFDVAAGCGGMSSEALDKVEALMEFESTLKSWNANKISDEDLKMTLKEIRYSRLDYVRNKRKNELEVEKDILDAFENSGFAELLN